MEPMDLGEALARFDAGLRSLHAALEPHPNLADELFADTEGWINLLRYKLTPHLAGEGCLIVALAGGTNTGKSTVFNLLLGRDVSPVSHNAAATRHPVIAASPMRAEQCLSGALLPEFVPRPLEDAEDVLSHELPDETLIVVEDASLPGRLLLFDAPDVDSIDRANWAVAKNLRAAGDVLIAVLSPEKYKDDKVIEYFRQALESGRLVLPLMNKANPARSFAIAREQLEDFTAVASGGVEGAPVAPFFVIPHDFSVEDNFTKPIEMIGDGLPLREYLETLEVKPIKERVFRGSVLYFADEAGAFLNRAEEMASRFHGVIESFEHWAEDSATQYDPRPGREVGGLFHQFVQSKRGKVERWIGAASASVAKGAIAVSRKITASILRSSSLENRPAAPDESALRREHEEQIRTIARGLATRYFEEPRRLDESLAPLVLNALEGIDIDAAVEGVVQDALAHESISEDYRRHADRMLETWWTDHKGKRRVLEALDAVLLIAPTAIAFPIALHTGGLGVAEGIMVAGPAAEQFLARVAEYQFGDKMFDLLSPWKREQQKALENALKRHLTAPALAAVRACVTPLDGGALAALRETLEQCRKI